ncbi:hypothetical protein LTR95_012346 [Oleoguttula sp. CCFEE 5521]
MPGGEDIYHWALLVGPKSDKKEDEGVRYHARERIKQYGGAEWVFEELSVSMMPTQMILVRLVIAKVENVEKLAQARSRGVWNCVSWVKEALFYIEASKNVIGTSVVEWEPVRNAAMTYCKQKKEQHRFDGKGKYDTSRVPTFHLTLEEETIE